ncbi:hypothetical protein Tco_0496528 [Tanacetum coccineum]
MKRGTRKREEFEEEERTQEKKIYGKPEDANEIEDMIESEDETVPASVYEVGSGVEQGTAAMEKLVEKFGNAEEKAECEKLKKEREEARGFVFEERPNEAIDVLVKDEKSPSSKPRGYPRNSYVDVAIVAERARHANAGNDARGSRPVRGQDAAPDVRECTFAGFMKCNPTIFRGVEGAVELRRWFKKTKSVFGISECAEGKKVKFDATTLEGPALTWWNSMIATLGLETVN